MTGRSRHVVIADAWAEMVSKPGLGQRTGKEQIVDKAWIDPSGRLVSWSEMGDTHQEYARRVVRHDPKSWTEVKLSGDQNRDQLRAENAFLGRGWIRVQAYDASGLGLQGLDDAIKARGHVALQLVPKPRRVYVQIWPDNETSLYLPEDLIWLSGEVAPKTAAMTKTAWTTLEDILRPIRSISGLHIDERIRRTNKHLADVVDSPSYPKPITDAMIDQALILARENLLGSLAARIIDPRRR